MTQHCDIGLIGLAVMGENLALNIESRGYSRRRLQPHDEQSRRVHRRPREGQEVRRLPLARRAGRKPRQAAQDHDDGQGRARRSTTSSRRCIPLLRQGRHPHRRRQHATTPTPSAARSTSRAKGLLYIGTGVSGGEEGALKGPSMMPGGSRDAWPAVKPIFQAIAAKVGPKNDIPCCEWVGPRGAGHYVKMVHNGIEYGDMQLICEAYFMMKEALGLSNEELYDVFAEWNRGELDSYLIEITRDIFSVKDTGRRRLPRRQDHGQGRREGHRQVDEPARARPRRAQHAGDRSRVRPLPVGDEGRPRAGEQSAQRPVGQDTTATARSSSSRFARRSTRRRSAATPKASCRCRRRPRSTTGR